MQLPLYHVHIIIIISIISYFQLASAQPDVVLSWTTNTLAEQDLPIPIFVQLGSQPTATVTMQIQTCVVLETSVQTLTFSATDWNIQQQVAISPHPDEQVTGNLLCRVVFTCTSTDTGYDTLEREANVQFLDSDHAGISLGFSDAGVLVTPGDSVQTLGGSSYSFTVALTSFPTQDVLLIVSSPTADLVLEATALTIAASQWNIPTVGNFRILYSSPTQLGLIIVNATSVDPFYATGISFVLQLAITYQPLPPVLTAASGYTAATEAGGQGMFTMALREPPTSSVNVSFISQSPRQIAMVTTRLFFTTANWNVQQAVYFTGVGRTVNPEGNVTASIYMYSNSSDPVFNHQNATKIVANIDVTWPGVFSIRPFTVPFGAENSTVCTLTGSNLLSAVNIYVQRRASASGLLSRLFSGVSGAFANIVSSNDTTVFFHVTPLNLTGYTNVTVLNRDGGFLTMENALYYSADCPYEGLYGYSNSCVACPTGAYCPGGARLWPLDGYYSQSESTGYVLKCPLASRCIGGVHLSSCAVGTEGYLCGQCSLQYYWKQNMCHACAPSQMFVIGMTVLQGGWYVIVVLVAALLHSDVATWFIFLCAGLRVMWTANINSALPLDVPAEVFSWLAWFVGDLSFMQSPCLELLSTWQLTFAANMGSCVAAVLLAIFLTQWSRYPVRRTLVIIVPIFFNTILVWSLQGLYCSQSEGYPFLIADSSVVCWSGYHIAVAACSAVLLAMCLAFAIWAPISQVRVLRAALLAAENTDIEDEMQLKQPKEDPEIQHDDDFVPLPEPEARPPPIEVMTVLDAVLLLAIHLPMSVSAILIHPLSAVISAALRVGCCGLGIILVVAVRPYKLPYQFVLSVMSFAAGMFIALGTAVQNLNASAAALLGYVGLVLFGIFALTAIVVLFWLCANWRTLPEVQYRDLISGIEQRELDEARSRNHGLRLIVRRHMLGGVPGGSFVTMETRFSPPETADPLSIPPSNLPSDSESDHDDIRSGAVPQLPRSDSQVSGGETPLLRKQFETATSTTITVTAPERATGSDAGLHATASPVDPALYEVSTQLPPRLRKSRGGTDSDTADLEKRIQARAQYHSMISDNDVALPADAPTAETIARYRTHSVEHSFTDPSNEQPRRLAGLDALRRAPLAPLTAITESRPRLSADQMLPVHTLLPNRQFGSASSDAAQRSRSPVSFSVSPEPTPR